VLRSLTVRIRKLLLRRELDAALPLVKAIRASPITADHPRASMSALELERSLGDEDERSAVFWNERLSADLRDAERLCALRRTNLLDSEPEDGFDALTRRICARLGVPVSLVSLVDADRQFFKSIQGLPEPWLSLRETPLTHSFCQHVVFANEPLIVTDARSHALVKGNLAIPDLGVIAYAGVPLRTHEGHAIGSLCAIDTKPRSWSDDDLWELRRIADAAENEIERHRITHPDATTLSAATGGDGEPLLANFADRFLEIRREELPQMERWAQEGHLEQVAQTGHQIKGSAATFGFPKLGEVGARLELAANAGDAEEVSALVATLRSALEAM
jgi:HPt (histidine-containing phosphotransfer) domain-containing protein